MAGLSKRSYVDLTADSSDIDQEPQRKVAKRPFRQNQQLSIVPVYNLIDISDEDDGTNEIVASSQYDNTTEGFIEIGRIEGKVVGIQYYKGYASPGEAVLVRREPTNPYDRNAIRIDNVQGNQIGYIPRKVAEKLVPFMDSRQLTVEGILTGEKGTFDVPIRLFLYGTSDPIARAQLETRIKDQKLPVAKKPKLPKKPVEKPNRKKLGLTATANTGGLAGRGEGEAPDLENIMENAEIIRPRELEELVEHWAATEESLEQMPLAEQPKALQAQLLPYQLQGLHWLLAMENQQLPVEGSKDIVQLWRRSNRPGWFQNIATQYTVQIKPVLANGGILADDMGLGKTLQVISLIVQGGKGPTLILAPVSVMSNWSQQIERHVKDSHALKVLTYHGSTRRALTNAEFNEYDVVISTYGTLGTEYAKMNSKTGLFAANWRRVVLDEGHIIRNAATKAANAVCNLKATSRWVLTGTPIVNTVKDLHSMLKFLRITGGLERADVFNSVLARPLTSGDMNADMILQSIMRQMCLRRTKDMKFVDLKIPPLTEYIHHVKFRPDEQEKYDALYAEGQGMLDKYLQRNAQPNSKSGDTYRNLLEILLRMRQVCCHWKLCNTRITALLKLIADSKVVTLTPETTLALQAQLQLSIDTAEDCPICLEPLSANNNPVITVCKHAFCTPCITRIITSFAGPTSGPADPRKCPMCRHPLTEADKFVAPNPELSAASVNDEPETPARVLDSETKSSKTEALIDIVRATLATGPESKIVVFSQWTSFLDIIQARLQASAIQHARIDGRMSAPARDRAIRALDREPSCRVLLASLSVCAVGLNLVSADTVILADSWWAPAIEDQAVDRVHRLGQTRETTVWRLIVEGSVEERVLEVQKEKRRLVGRAFREKGARGEGREADLRRLLG